MGKFKIENVIGAGIALLSVIMLTFLPLIKGLALFGIMEEGGMALALSFTWIIFPLIAVICHLFGKVKLLTAFLMLFPVLCGLVYVHYGVAGAGYWVYVAMTIILIVYTIIVKKKMTKRND